LEVEKEKLPPGSMYHTHIKETRISVSAGGELSFTHSVKWDKRHAGSVSYIFWEKSSELIIRDPLSQKEDVYENIAYSLSGIGFDRNAEFYGIVPKDFKLWEKSRHLRVTPRGWDDSDFGPDLEGTLFRGLASPIKGFISERDKFKTQALGLTVVRGEKSNLVPEILKIADELFRKKPSHLYSPKPLYEKYRNMGYSDIVSALLTVSVMTERGGSEGVVFKFWFEGFKKQYSELEAAYRTLDATAQGENRKAVQDVLLQLRTQLGIRGGARLAAGLDEGEGQGSSKKKSVKRMSKIQRAVDERFRSFVTGIEQFLEAPQLETVSVSGILENESRELSKAEYSVNKTEQILMKLEPRIRNHLVEKGFRLKEDNTDLYEVPVAEFEGARRAGKSKDPAVVGLELLIGIAKLKDIDNNLFGDDKVSLNQVETYTNRHVTRAALHLNKVLIRRTNDWLHQAFRMTTEPDLRDKKRHKLWKLVKKLRDDGIDRIQIEVLLRRGRREVNPHAAVRRLFKRTLERIGEEELKGIVPLPNIEASEFMGGRPGHIKLGKNKHFKRNVASVVEKAFSFEGYTRKEAGGVLRDWARQLRKEGLWRFVLVDQIPGGYTNNADQVTRRMIEAMEKDERYRGNVRLSDTHIADLTEKRPYQSVLSRNAELIEGIKKRLNDAFRSKKLKNKDSDAYYWYRKASRLRRRVHRVTLVKRIGVGHDRTAQRGTGARLASSGPSRIYTVDVTHGSNQELIPEVIDFIDRFVKISEDSSVEKEDHTGDVKYMLHVDEARPKFVVTGQEGQEIFVKTAIGDRKVYLDVVLGRGGVFRPEIPLLLADTSEGKIYDTEKPVFLDITEDGANILAVYLPIERNNFIKIEVLQGEGSQQKAIDARRVSRLMLDAAGHPIHKITTRSIIQTGLNIGSRELPSRGARLAAGSSGEGRSFEGRIVWQSEMTEGMDRIKGEAIHPGGDSDHLLKPGKTNAQVLFIDFKKYVADIRERKVTKMRYKPQIEKFFPHNVPSLRVLIFFNAPTDRFSVQNDLLFAKKMFRGRLVVAINESLHNIHEARFEVDLEIKDTYAKLIVLPPNRSSHAGARLAIHEEEGSSRDLTIGENEHVVKSRLDPYAFKSFIRKTDEYKSQLKQYLDANPDSKHITAHQRKRLTLRHGLDDGVERTYDEIKELLGLRSKQVVGGTLHYAYEKLERYVPWFQQWRIDEVGESEETGARLATPTGDLPTRQEMSDILYRDAESARALFENRDSDAVSYVLVTLKQMAEATMEELREESPAGRTEIPVNEVPGLIAMLEDSVARHPAVLDDPSSDVARYFDTAQAALESIRTHQIREGPESRFREMDPDEVLSTFLEAVGDEPDFEYVKRGLLEAISEIDVDLIVVSLYGLDNEGVFLEHFDPVFLNDLFWSIWTQIHVFDQGMPVKSLGLLLQISTAMDEPYSLNERQLMLFEKALLTGDLTEKRAATLFYANFSRPSMMDKREIVDKLIDIAQGSEWLSADTDEARYMRREALTGLQKNSILIASKYPGLLQDTGLIDRNQLIRDKARDALMRYLRDYIDDIDNQEFEEALRWNFDFEMLADLLDEPEEPSETSLIRAARYSNLIEQITSGELKPSISQARDALSELSRNTFGARLAVTNERWALKGTIVHLRGVQWLDFLIEMWGIIEKYVADISNEYGRIRYSIKYLIEYLIQSVKETLPGVFSSLAPHRSFPASETFAGARLSGTAGVKEETRQRLEKLFGLEKTAVILDEAEAFVQREDPRIFDLKGLDRVLGRLRPGFSSEFDHTFVPILDSQYDSEYNIRLWVDYELARRLQIVHYKFRYFQFVFRAKRSSHYLPVAFATMAAIDRKRKRFESTGGHHIYYGGKRVSLDDIEEHLMAKARGLSRRGKWIGTYGRYLATVVYWLSRELNPKHEAAMARSREVLRHLSEGMTVRDALQSLRHQERRPVRGWLKSRRCL